MTRELSNAQETAIKCIGIYECFFTNAKAYGYMVLIIQRNYFPITESLVMNNSTLFNKRSVKGEFRGCWCLSWNFYFRFHCRVCFWRRNRMLYFA